MTDTARSLARVLRGGLVGAIAITVSIGCNTLSGADDLVALTCEGADCSTDDRQTSLDAKTSGERSNAPGGGQGSTSNGGSSNGGGNGDGGGGEPVACGETACSGASPVCCVGQNETKTCIAGDEVCNGVLITCGGRSNCNAGEVCCLDMFGAKAECRPEGSCAAAAIQLVVCRSDADCPAGATCHENAGSLPEHKFCN